MNDTLESVSIASAPATTSGRRRPSLRRPASSVPEAVSSQDDPTVDAASRLGGSAAAHAVAGREHTGEDREVLIYMNNPLRYEGETYYQSGYDERDDRITILQVVRNPSWLVPYISCTLVGIGLTIHFMMHLTRFIRRKLA